MDRQNDKSLNGCLDTGYYKMASVSSLIKFREAKHVG